MSKKPFLTKKGLAPGRTPADKLNPNSIRKLLWDVYEANFESDAEAAIALNKHCKFSWGGGVSFTPGMLRKLLDDKTMLKYWHIQAFADYLGIPSGMLLLFSRLRSNAERGATADTRRILAAMAELGTLIEHDDDFGPDTLARWISLTSHGQTALDLSQ